MNYKTTVVWLSILLILSTTIHAETWQIGLLAENSRPPFISEQWETNVLPMVNYIGDKFSFIGGKVKYELSSANTGETYITGQIRSRQFYSASLDSNNDLNLEGMEDRKSAFELGLGLKKITGWGHYVLEGVMDVSEAHKGFEITAKYSYPKLIGSWLVEPAIGLQLQSSNLADYYHGVKVSEVQDGRTAYRGNQAVNMLTSLMVGYRINAQWLAIAGMEQIVLDTNITDSPIVSKEKARKIYLGLIYTF